MFPLNVLLLEFFSFCYSFFSSQDILLSCSSTFLLVSYLYIFILLLNFFLLKCLFSSAFSISDTPKKNAFLTITLWLTYINDDKSNLLYVNDKMNANKNPNCKIVWKYDQYLVRIMLIIILNIFVLQRLRNPFPPSH